MQSVRKSEIGDEKSLSELELYKNKSQVIQLVENIKNALTPYIEKTDENKRLVNDYDSISKASKALIIDAKCIRDALSGKQKTAKGYAWAYCNDA